MPIENERKFVLDEDGQPDPRLSRAPGVTKSRLTQAYLDSAGVRIRSIEVAGRLHHVFSFKRPVDGQMVEIETEIDDADFKRLWTLGRETLSKTLYSWDDGRFHWDIDFFKTGDGRTSGGRWPKSRCPSTSSDRRRSRRAWRVTCWGWRHPATRDSPRRGWPISRMPSVCWPRSAPRV